MQQWGFSGGGLSGGGPGRFAKVGGSDCLLIVYPVHTCIESVDPTA
jgi:hypothetical protein